MKTDEIRQAFLEYFKEHGHTIVASDSLAPQDDPTLLFTGAGMNQFKDYFLGLKKDLKRAASSQKCLRTGDLDEVGRTAYHHSFFEMLGNFSFGDYFKKEAIEWAWEFFTTTMRLPKERLRVSIHQSDDEAYGIWKNSIGLPDKSITRMGDKTNFWPSNAREEGPNGPCGPCSEIYFDQGKESVKDRHECSIEHDCGRFAEIWNLVFTQYDRQDGGKLVPLAQKNIDTGMGLERLACIVQKKKTNFETDIFDPINQAVKENLKLSDKSAKSAFHIYAISDHVRAVTFAITDGIIPANEGRGYVIRKLIRRALWRAHQLLGRELREPFLYKVASDVIEVMEKAYPELRKAEGNIKGTLKGEEERFLKTLETGLALLKEKIRAAKKKGEKNLSGEEAFLLYDTYGFPDELTKVIAEGEGLEIDQKGFEELMEGQRKRAKGTSPLVQSIFVTSELDKRLHGLQATEFLGYSTHRARGRVLLVQRKGNRAIVLLDRTPFYAESGGQVGDQGMLMGPGLEANVEDTQKKDKYVLHSIRVVKGKIEEGMEVEAQVDSKKRDQAMRNHTATHLLHAVLREVLGKQVRQLGSLVHPDRLRFDYSFSRPLTQEEFSRIEQRVNEEILKDTLVQKEEKGFDDAQKEGAIAFFGEKYGKKVRIVTVPGISKELCGGTHCERTGQIGSFVITSDSSIASGVRRIEALTGEGALRYVQILRSQVNLAAERLRTTPAELVERIEKLQEKAKKLEKEGKENRAPSVDPKKLLESGEKAGGYTLILEKIDGAGKEELRKVSDLLRSQAKRAAWFLLSSADDKVSFLIGLSADLKDEAIDAREISKQIVSLIDGSGGGRRDLVEGGAKDVELVEKNWKTLTTVLKSYLKGK